MAAFLKAIDELVKQAENGTLKQEVSVIYVSPLKALSNDIHRNLESPLLGVHEYFESQRKLATEETPCIRAAVRTGDTPQSERVKMVKNPPQILVTTPESLYILLTSESGRACCRRRRR